jgi:putative acetyltransferase
VTAAPATIAREPLSSPDARRLIASLDAELSAIYPNPADNFFELGEEQTAGDRGVFLLARVDGRPVGCGALRRIDATTGEIKRMYVAPAARGAGLGRRLLDELERHARGLGLRRLVLETGPRQPEALGLYRRAGFAPVPCFGDYRHASLSVCMAKPLD